MVVKPVLTTSEEIFGIMRGANNAENCIGVTAPVLGHAQLVHGHLVFLGQNRHREWVLIRVTVLFLIAGEKYGC